MIGSRLVPDETARRLGYVTPAASPATGKRWWQRRQKVARVELLAPQLGQIKTLSPSRCRQPVEYRFPSTRSERPPRTPVRALGLAWANPSGSGSVAVAR